MPPVLTEPHAPVSNLADAPESSASQQSEPEVGSAGHSIEPGDDGREALAAELVVEEGAGIEAPEGRFPDIGAAAFEEPDVVLETVHGPDNRIRVQDTASYPYRVNASLLITARDGSQWIGTGWFISPRTLITAAHCVHIKGSPVAARNGWVKSIQVMPGRNEAALPYGAVTSTEFWSVRGWTESSSGDENYDYGAIILPTPLGDRTGLLGFANLPDADLVGAVANVTGYPGDKPSGQLWYDAKAIAAVNPGKVHYDIDTYGGQSGSAVYVIRTGQRYAVAVHTYGGAVTNSGTRISAPVFANLQNWKR